jgi:isoquinoline 1-oxidoreductase subunit beta
MNTESALLSRRTLLQGLGGLTVAIALPAEVFAQGTPPAPPSTLKAGAGANATADMLTAYVIVGPDGRVKVLSPTTEMGQGSHTAHAAIVADELGVSIDQVSVETALPADSFRWGGSMGSGGSWGVRRWAPLLHKGAAQAREMLIAAASVSLNVPAAALTLSDGQVRHAGSGRSLPIGGLVAAAAKLTPPESPTLRSPAEFRYVGKGTPRLDIPAKVTGRQIYSQDFRLPGMLYACARFNPVFHGTVSAIDDKAALAVRGVRKVVPIPGGAAVVADSSWAAMRGADALVMTPAPSANDGLNSAGLTAAMAEGLGAATAVEAKALGDVAAALKGAARTVTADYQVPYLAHAPMETWSGTALLKDGGLELWLPTQVQDRSLRTAAATSGLAQDRITLHTLLLGGGFGRRLTADDAVPSLVACAQALPGTPVKLFWRREDEFERGWFRPAQSARLTAGLTKDGEVTGLHIRTSGPSLTMEFVPGRIKEGELDRASVQDLPDVRYRLPAYRVDYAMRHIPVTVAPWRSVGATQNAFFLECFIDELAAAAKQDPVAFRRRLLAHDARALAVVNLAAEKANWGQRLPAGQARGFAFFESYGSLAAHVVVASLKDGQPRVHHVTAVLDCGDVVLPDGARSQVEGGVIQGLSTALYEAATISGGQTVQKNFDSYRLLRFPEAPTVDVHFIRSGKELGGVGEPGLPPAAPALANAISTLTGKRVRSLPIVTA